MWNPVRRAVAAASAALLTVPAVAQAPNAPPVVLLEAKALKCTFPVIAAGDWKGGVAEAAVKPATLAVAFTKIDTQDGTAEASGDSGKSHITVRLLGNYLHFMQVDPYGALYVTTVFNRETKAGRLQAAHSRHEYLPVVVRGLTSRPEQYYGECEVSK
jgi:hypothetical protein